jgi:sulfofructose kinase
MARILCLGNAVWDRYFEMESIPSQATKYFARGYFEEGGGVAATAAVAARRLGADVSLVSRLGEDNNGVCIARELESWGVDTGYLRRFPGAASSHAVVHVDGAGERQITVFRDAGLPTGSDWLRPEMLDGVDCLLCDTSWPEGALFLLQQARARGIPGVLDLDLGASRMDELVPLGDYQAFSWPGLQQFTGEETPEKALRVAQRSTAGVVCVTRGEEGCYWLDNGELRHIPAFSVDCVSTSGAGDVFHGALAVAIGEGQSVARALKFASAAAALKCTSRGGREGIPGREQLERFLQ